MATPPIYKELWEAWTTKSDREDPGVDWDRVVHHITSDPSIALFSNEDCRGMLLLHFACALYPPEFAIEAILSANPRAVYKSSSSSGLTPLMVACGRNASVGVIRLLLRNARDTAKIQDATGYTAVHWACREDVASAVLRQLLIVDPTLARNHATRGRMHSVPCSPMDLLLQHSARTTWNQNQWTKIENLLWAIHYGTLAVRAGQSLSTLHAALAQACNKRVIQTALQYYGEESSGVVDIFGNLPLHYAVSVSTNVTGENVIHKLLEYFPQAAARRDCRGRLPLHVALKQGKKWQDGVHALYTLYPLAVTLQDSECSVFPAFLAAIYSDTETIFCLLRAYPEIVIPGNVKNLSRRSACAHLFEKNGDVYVCL